MDAWACEMRRLAPSQALARRLEQPRRADGSDDANTLLGHADHPADSQRGGLGLRRCQNEHGKRHKSLTSEKRQNCLGTAVMEIASPDQGLDLAVGDTALEHPEAAIRMNVFDPLGAEHLFGALDCARDLIRRLDLG